MELIIKRIVRMLADIIQPAFPKTSARLFIWTLVVPAKDEDYGSVDRYNREDYNDDSQSEWVKRQAKTPVYPKYILKVEIASHWLLAVGCLVGIILTLLLTIAIKIN